MFLFKVVCKIMVVPVIIILTVILGIAGICEKISSAIMGVLNIVFALAGVTSVISTGEWTMAKQIIIFLVIEFALFGIIEIGLISLETVKERMVQILEN